MSFAESVDGEASVLGGNGGGTRATYIVAVVDLAWD
jgi:hypothetical protein